MSTPYLGQIQPFPYNFAPRFWAFCNGQQLSIAQNTALFSLLGTTYGGNGVTTFALPDLRGRAPMHFGTAPGGGSYVQGQVAGTETVTLIINQLPAHNHSFSGTNANSDSKRPVTGSAYAQTTTAASASPGDNFYAPAGSPTVTALAAGTLGALGGNQPHSNMQPYLTISWCIALSGVFPSRN